MKAKNGRQTNPDISDSVSHTLSDGESHSPVPEISAPARDPRQVRTDQALRGALLTLLERKAFDRITVREICAEAGVHNATFFRHHETKEALLDHVAADQIDRLVELTLPAGEGPEGFRFLCEYVDAHRMLWTALLTGGAAGAMRAELLKVAKGLAVDRAPPTGWLPVELATICSTTLIVETLSWWLVQKPGDYPVPEVARILHRLVDGAMVRP